MTTISVPIPQDLEIFIQSMIDSNKAETKAEVVRIALRKAKEAHFVEEILAARDSVKKYGTFSGDLDLLTKNM